MRYTKWLLLVITLLLMGCAANTARQSNGKVEFASSALNDRLEETYIHTQPDADFAYYYNIIIEKKTVPEHVSSKQRTANNHRSSDTVEKVIWDRIRANFRLPSSSHPRVQAELRWFASHPQYLERVYDRAEPVLHYVFEEVRKAGLPAELALLPIVESAYQPFAFSHARASGIWQFIPSTGRLYGLKQNWWYDGRRDIVESTRAGIQYLKKLRDQFNGDWLLALAAYNTGEGRVAREVRRNLRRGLRADFWHLRLPRETRQYVPKLLAIKAIVANPKKYGLVLRPIADHRRLVAVNTGGQIDLAIAAELAGISLDEMYKLNPGFNRWATDPSGPHRLMIPIELANDFKRKLAKLPRNKRVIWKHHQATRGQTLTAIARQYNISAGLLRRVNALYRNRISSPRTIKIPVSYIARSKYSLTLTQRYKADENKVLRNRRRFIYRVRRGDTLSRVARRYRVSKVTLARWNSISPRARLRRGQRLVVFRKRRHRIHSPRNLARFGGIRKIRYVVRRGDTLHSISRLFRVSVRKIRLWNKRLRRRGNIYPGQRLKLYVKSKYYRRAYRLSR